MADDSERSQLEFEQILSTIRRQNRQPAIEIWKVVLASLVAGGIFGGTVVQLANMIGG